jgi:hypothetical protein
MTNVTITLKAMRWAGTCFLMPKTTAIGHPPCKACSSNKTNTDCLNAMEFYEMKHTGRGQADSLEARPHWRIPASFAATATAFLLQRRRHTSVDVSYPTKYFSRGSWVYGRVLNALEAPGGEWYYLLNHGTEVESPVRRREVIWHIEDNREHHDIRVGVFLATMIWYVVPTQDFFSFSTTTTVLHRGYRAAPQGRGAKAVSRG